MELVRVVNEYNINIWFISERKIFFKNIFKSKIMLNIFVEYLFFF